MLDCPITVMFYDMKFRLLPGAFGVDTEQSPARMPREFAMKII